MIASARPMQSSGPLMVRYSYHERSGGAFYGDPSCRRSPYESLRASGSEGDADTTA